LNITSNLLLGFVDFVFFIIGFYIVLAILELLTNIFKINISIFDSFFGYFINKKDEMILQATIGNIYSLFFEIILWLTPIACTITASILAYIQMKKFYWGILGGIVGLIAGIFIDVALYGLSVILLNIRSSFKNIEDNS